LTPFSDELKFRNRQKLVETAIYRQNYSSVSEQTSFNESPLTIKNRKEGETTWKMKSYQKKELTRK
jgi:hypothetical protein